MKETFLDETVQHLRKAADIQRQVRRFAQSIIKPGERLADIC
jgi:methionine aminopeptidase